MGTIELAIPKVRPGTYFPSLLQPRRRAEHALLAVVQEAWVHGVSTRKVDDLVKALGVDGISKSEVSRICSELDVVVTAFRTRALSGEHRYLRVDATYHEVRIDGRVVSQATVVAVGVTSEGDCLLVPQDGSRLDNRVRNRFGAEENDASLVGGEEPIAGGRISRLGGREKRTGRIGLRAVARRSSRAHV